MTATWTVELISEPTVLKPEGPWATLYAWLCQKHNMNAFYEARRRVELSLTRAIAPAQLLVDHPTFEFRLEIRPTWGNATVHCKGETSQYDLTVGQLATLTSLVEAESVTLPPMEGPPEFTIRVTFPERGYYASYSPDRLYRMLAESDQHRPSLTTLEALKLGGEIERVWAGRSA